MSNLDRLLLETGCKYANLAYEEEIPKAIKVESKLTSTTAFVMKTEKLDIIAFRGTQQLRDWLFNLSAIPVPYAGRLCHGGFVAAHASIWGKIKKHIDKEKNLLICGHSLGGALAELSAAKLYKSHPQLSLVTFGKPNTFFKGFKRAMNLNGQLSVVSGSDIVSRVPRLCYGPSISQSLIYFANNGDDFVDPPPELKKRDFMEEKTEAISDHFMGGYKERLNKYLAKKKKKSVTIQATSNAPLQTK